MGAGGFAAPGRPHGRGHPSGDSCRPVADSRIRHDLLQELEVRRDRSHRIDRSGLHRLRRSSQAPGRPSEAVRGPGSDTDRRCSDDRIVPVGSYRIIVRGRDMHPHARQTRRHRRRGVRVPRRPVEDLSRGSLAHRRDRRGGRRHRVRVDRDASRRTPVPSRLRGPTVTPRPIRRTASVSRPWRRTSWGRPL